MQRNDGKALLCKAGSYRNVVSQMWEELAIYQQDAILRPDYYICAGARVMDFSGSVDLDKIMMLMEVEMQMINPSDDVIIVGAKTVCNNRREYAAIWTRVVKETGFWMRWQAEMYRKNQKSFRKFH